MNKLELDTVFGNFEELLKVVVDETPHSQIHADFFNSIKAHISQSRLSQLIVQEFLKTSNQFYLYTDYCSSYCDALRLLQRLLVERPGLEQRLELLQKDPRSKGHDIFSYLIKPIQVGGGCGLHGRGSASTRCSSRGCWARWRRTTRSGRTWCC